MRLLRVVAALWSLSFPHWAGAADQGWLTTSYPDGGPSSFKGFRGHSIDALLSTLGRRVMAQPKKSEYETTSAFSNRQDEWKKGRLIGDLTVESRWAFVFPLDAVKRHSPGSRLSYDADSEKLSLEIDSECGGGAGLIWKSSRRDLGSYVAKNAFGVAAKVTKKEYLAWCIRLQRTPEWLNQYALNDVKPDVARAAAASGSLVLIGRLVAPYVDLVSENSAATIQYPVQQISVEQVVEFDLEEVVVFLPQSGERVLHVVSPATFKRE